jgi:hypothetical protein
LQFVRALHEACASPMSFYAFDFSKGRPEGRGAVARQGEGAQLSTRAGAIHSLARRAIA